MSSSHVFFIPAILLAGVVVGYLMGRRAVQAEIDERERAEERKAARRAARAAPDAP